MSYVIGKMRSKFLIRTDSVGKCAVHDFMWIKIGQNLVWEALLFCYQTLRIPKIKAINTSSLPLINWSYSNLNLLLILFYYILEQNGIQWKWMLLISIIRNVYFWTFTSISGDRVLLLYNDYEEEDFSERGNLLVDTA